MDADSTVHPTNETLRAFGLGKLADEAAEVVGQHLGRCPECLRQVADLSSDSFLERLRQARSPAGDTEGRPAGLSYIRHAAPPEARPTAGTLPPELASNPDYEIVRELSGGGMGRVFHVHNRIMGRDEVLKIVGPAIVELPGARDRFLREIRAVARLRHPNIVTGYTTFRAGASLVFAMEYVDGLDLARMVKAKGPMPVGHACYFVHQAALGLQHAHQAGMVHRDIKPSNLMLTHTEGRAAIKVLDFGLAKAGSEQVLLELGAPRPDLDMKAAAGLTMAGQMLGTPDFIAPEQIADARAADIRADIYSLGCTLYYLLSGRPPFEAKKLTDVLKAHRATDAMPLNLARPEVPVELAAVVARMMAKQPDRRFQTPGEVAKALVPFFKKRSAASQSPGYGSLPADAPDALVTAAVSTQPATKAGAAASPDPAGGTWSSLIELKETEEDSAEVSPASQPVGERTRWRQPAAAAAGGLAAVLLVAVILLFTPGRPKTVNELTQTDIPQTSPEVAATTPEDLAIEPPPPKASPPAPPAEVGKTPDRAPPRQPLVPRGELPRLAAAPERRDLSFGEQVTRAIRDGVRFLKGQQRVDGSWSDVEDNAKTGVTSLVTLALLAAGEPTRAPAIDKALGFLRGFGPFDLNNTYAISLQTMVFAAVDPNGDRLRIASNVEWLEGAQITQRDPQFWPGSWAYNYRKPGERGDQSNTQYALLGLFAAYEAGVPVKPEVWQLAASHWKNSQMDDGGWSYNSGIPKSTASMTSAGVSNSIMLGGSQGNEFLQGDSVRNCGKGLPNRKLQAGIDWLANHFRVDENVGSGTQWKYYYLYGLERAARLAGMQCFGPHEWYQQGAQELLRKQDKIAGIWRGQGQENELVATSFALLFLAKGRAPVLIKKLRHGPADDWNNDPDDVRYLANIVSLDWKTLLTWQVVDSETATVPNLLQAPIVFFNGHLAPAFSSTTKQNLRTFVEQGGFIFAEACCSSREFDQGFKQLMKEVFPEESYRLRPLSEDHPVWRARHLLAPDIHPLWGIEHGCRTVVIYSPADLSCYWHQCEQSPTNVAVMRAIKVGQNVIDFATGREMPADKLAVREVRTFTDDAPRPNALRIAKLIHGGDWNVAPRAVPNLMEAMRRPPLNFDVVINQKGLSPRDPDLMFYPMIYVHGRTGMSINKDDQGALGRYLEPGGGTIFADAACGSLAFDAAFRRFVAELLPKNPLVPIPREDELFTVKVRYDLSDVQYTKAAGGGHGPPQLEGVKINNHWAVIYSKYDIGCALEHNTGIERKGYTHESAVKIATNIVVYAKLP